MWSGHDELRQGMIGRVERFGRHPRVTLTEIRYQEPWAFVGGTLESPDGSLPETWIVKMRDELVYRADAFTIPGAGESEWRRRVTGTL